MAAAVVERGDRVGPEDRLDRCLAGDDDAVERHADERSDRCRGVVRDRGGWGSRPRRDGLTPVEPFDHLLDAVVLVLRVDVGSGRCFERLRGVGDVDVPLVIVEVPVLIVVDLGQVQDELAVDVVQRIAVEPDADLVSGVRRGARTERPHLGVGGVAGDGDLVAGGRGATREGALGGRGMGGEGSVEEQVEIDGPGGEGLVGVGRRLGR
jgi:hypothetical protein